MKTLFYTFLLACTSWLSADAQGVLRITLTPQVRQQVRQCNETARKAASHILDESVLGGNIRSRQTTYVADLHVISSTADSVQIYSNDRVFLAYSPRYNAFLPVRTREAALRLAMDTYDPLVTGSNRGIYRRKPDLNGLHAEILLDILEDRSRLPWKETEEEVLK